MTASPQRVGAGCALLLGAWSAAGTGQTASVLARPDAGERAVLERAVAELTGAPSVHLADDVLLQDSVMIVEKVRPKDGRGVPLTGRDFDHPEAFALSWDEGCCVLSRLKTGAKVALPSIHCVPRSAGR